jgi:hypothetical protein
MLRMVAGRYAELEQQLANNRNVFHTEDKHGS